MIPASTGDKSPYAHNCQQAAAVKPKIPVSAGSGYSQEELRTFASERSLKNSRSCPDFLPLALQIPFLIDLFQQSQKDGGTGSDKAYALHCGGDSMPNF